MKIKDQENRKQLKLIGLKCSIHRRALKRTQTDVARETGYTQRNISTFEKGFNNNAIILLWYLENGIPIEELLK